MEPLNVILAKYLDEYKLGISSVEVVIAKIKGAILSQDKPKFQDRVQIFKREVFAWNYKNKNKYDLVMLDAFLNHWARLEKDGLAKFETEKNFKIGARLSTYARLNKQFQGKNKIDQFKNLASLAVNPLR